MRRGELQTRSLQKVQEQILFYYLGSCSAVTVAISVLVDSATVLNSAPILSLRYVKGTSTWEFGVTSICSWTMMPLSHHVCHHLSLSSIFALVLRVGSSISILKAKQRNLPRRSWTWWLPPIFLETTMIIMVRFLHAVLSGCCMHQQQQLKNTYKERPVMSIFDVLERSTVWRWQNTELLQWWHKLKKNCRTSDWNTIL